MPLGAFKAALMGTAGATTAGDVVLLSSQTASGSASLDFTSGIDSTYGEYIFKFYNINPVSSSALTFQANAAGASGYNETMTTTKFQIDHPESDAHTDLSYVAGGDQAQGTAFQSLSQSIGVQSDNSGAGELHLFNPASTTYAKHFYSKMQIHYGDAGNASCTFIGGYINTTTAIDDIQFKMSTGNFDGTIKMWGVK